MDATLWQHLSASLARIAVALLAAGLTAIPWASCWAAVAAPAPLRSDHRVLPPVAAVGLPAADRHLVRHRRAIENLADLSSDFAPVVISTMAGVSAVAPDRLRAAQALGANPRQLLWYWCCQRSARHPDRYSHWPGHRLVHPGGRRTHRRHSGTGFMVQSAANFLVTDVVVLGILVIGAVAVGMELLIRALQRG